MKSLKINKKFWQNKNEIELKDFAQTLVDYYYRNGFPHASYNNDDKQVELQKVFSYNTSDILFEENGNKTLKQTMHGLSLLWSYFPHYIEVSCGGRKTPSEIFGNRKDFEKVVLKRLKYGDYITDAGILKALKSYSGVGCVSNFRPTSATSLYNYFSYVLDRELVVWDFCGGWGGRLLGAYSADCVKTYICCEPSIKTFEGLRQLESDICLTKAKKSYVVNSVAEKFILPFNSVDCVFTSPPYFNQEKYSNEQTQSYLSYPDYNIWLTEFWKKTVKNCFSYLKDDGIFSFNIANLKRYNLSYDMLKIAEECGFEWKETIQYSLSQHMYSKNSGSFKYEPVYIMRKK